MKDTFQLAEFEVEVTFKNIKNVHLSVNPPNGRVVMAAPIGTRPAAVRAFAASKLAWIRSKRTALANQAREPLRQYVPRESHMLWGKRYLLRIEERNEPPSVSVSHRSITLVVRPGSNRAKRARVFEDWQRSLLHEAIRPLVAKWEARLGVKLYSYALQRMKTKWGSCNRRGRRIRINTELIKKPRELLEYVVVHELMHILVKSHGDEFVRLLTTHFPAWREARSELNSLPLQSLDHS